ncbi:MAG TPA: hypothetical protein VFA74_03890 [Terriglobales bacterium]|nr:hypothetical protein [Terriglobales bacterium]
MPNIRLFSLNKKNVLGFIFSLMLTPTLLCFPAMAQHAPELEVFGGYSYLRFDSKPLGYASDSNLNGWNGSLTAPHLYRELGLVADVSGHYGSGLTEYNFMAGPQVTTDFRGFTVFGRFLYGRARDRVEINGQSPVGFSSLGRAIAIGGGVEKNLFSKFSYRLVQVDYINAKTLGQTQGNIRVSTGLVFRFGGR